MASSSPYTHNAACLAPISDTSGACAVLSEPYAHNAVRLVPMRMKA